MFFKDIAPKTPNTNIPKLQTKFKAQTDVTFS